MNSGGFLFIEPLYNLVFNTLVVLYRFMGEDLGLALIAVAILSRVILIPFTLRQLKNVDKNKEFQKQYQEIKEKFKKDKEKQTQELAKLQSQYLPGQLSGCLTLILQLLLLIQINYVIRNLLQNGTAAFNQIAYGIVGKFQEGYEFDVTFLGDWLNLGKSANNVGVANLSESWPYLLVALILVLTQFFSMKIMTGSNKPEPKPEKDEKKNDKGKKDDEVPSFSEVFQDTNRQMMMFFPLLLGFFSLNYPSGLSLYFATTSLFVIIQQGIMKRKELVERFREKFYTEEKETKEEKEKKDDKIEDKKPKKNKKSKKNKSKKKHGRK